ncbi:MAG: FtsX-like permease family protein [Opitutaceae bacterium]|nr:FtsX-like permease family protein [Opitutaceae bacterium]
MTAFRYILRSVAHHRFAYLGVFAGAVLGATVLLGALFAGDSVAASLRRIAAQRIGQATHVVAAGDRFFREALAAEFATAAGVRAAPVLLARGTATQPATRAFATQVQLVGVTSAFWQFAPEPVALALAAEKNEVAVNETLARRLALKVGDTLVVRLQKPGVLAGNAPIAGAEAKLEAVRCTVAVIVGDGAFGRFNLEATQVPPPSVFLPIALLQTALNRPQRANLLLLAGTKTDSELSAALARTVRLADYGLAVQRRDAAQAFDFTSERIFIDPPLARVIAGAVPAAQPVVSYLVNELRSGARATPYSIGTATTPAAAPFLPVDLGPGEVVINRWLADDLQIGPGAELAAKFFQVGAGDALIERSATFRVRAVVPIEGGAADRTWMPEFPGISDAKNQSEWDPGLPLQLERIRDHDERYWDDHRGTPKVFFAIAAGREMWATRWGELTALRVTAPAGAGADLERQALAALRPEMNQMIVRNVRAGAADSAQSAVDFGGLFLGMSFFLILAALGLVAMLFQLSLLLRNREDALLGAVGVPARQIGRWRLGEALLILLVAGVAGVPLAALYTQGILVFLERIWAGQGGGAVFAFAMKPSSVAGGLGAFLLISLGAVWLAIRRQTKRALSIRLAASAEETAPPAKARRNAIILAALAAVAGVAALIASRGGLPAQIAFYLAGFSWLVAGLAGCRAWLARELQADGVLDARRLARRNLSARRARSLTVVGLIATAVFMVLSVASFRKHVGADWLVRASGTGGFAFWIETTVPQNPPRDGRAAGFELFGKHAADLGAVVPIRVGTGDNVNCFNLNTTLQPRLLAVDAAALAARGAFRTKSAGWAELGALSGDGAIPALVDENTLLWALKRKVGDTLAYTDETGGAFTVRIVGTLPDSIFQGHLIVDEALFLKKFPSSGGYALFLADAKNPGGDLPALRDRLAVSAADAGGKVELTRDVLAAFHQIENTYIAIFTALGTLGVVLGSLGLAVVVARNLRERRGEFAVMAAIGLPRAALGRMVFHEFATLVAWGLAIGAASSSVAIAPSLAALPAAGTLAAVGAMLVGIALLNLACGWVVFRRATGELRPSVALAAG